MHGQLTIDGHGHDDHGHGGVHESSWVMLAPLVILAVLSIVGGWVGVPKFMGGHNEIDHFLAPVMEPASAAGDESVAGLQEDHIPGQHRRKIQYEEWILTGHFRCCRHARLIFRLAPVLQKARTARAHHFKDSRHLLMVLHKYYVDEGYGALFVKPLLALSTVVFWRGVDQGVIDGLVNGAGTTSKGIGNELRRMQSGNIRSYAAWVAIGGAAIAGLHDLAGGDAMSNSILTLVTFLPAIGALVLMLMPRNDRALRWAALIISIATFGLSPLSADVLRLRRIPASSLIRTATGSARPSTITWALTASPCGWCCSLRCWSR